MKRFVASVEYDGTHYSGWQSQPFFMANGRQPASIQTAVEEALGRIAAHPVQVVCAGRTDAGVHALQQIIHFDSDAPRTEYAWLSGGNRYLPADVRIQWLCETAPDFHARYSALERHYCYLLRDDGRESALWRHRFWLQRRPLQIEAMQRAAEALRGEHDFSAFRSAECQAKSPKRFIREICIERRGAWIEIHVYGNAFLHHMVRNIVGSLLPVGEGRRPESWLGEVLRQRDRRLAGVTAPPWALYFCGVRYPSQFPQPPARTGFFEAL